jgi:methionyl aminopeptidase
MQLGIDEIRPGNFFGNIGFAISKYAEKQWYWVVREYTGHGVGIEFHEEPYIYHKAAKNTGSIMKPGMIFTVEPMINEWTHKTRLLEDKWTVKTLDGKLSAQFEHTVLVTEAGYEILTK